MGTDKPTGRHPEPEEIEVTPEMIEAGYAIILADDEITLGPSGARDLAERVLRACLSAGRVEIQVPG